MRNKEWDGYDVQVKELALPNKLNSVVNIGRALACRCIQSERKRPDQYENVGVGLIVGGTLHADKSGNLGVIHAGRIGHIGHLLGSLNIQGGMIHADTDFDVLYFPPICHMRLNGNRLVT